MISCVEQRFRDWVRRERGNAGPSIAKERPSGKSRRARGVLPMRVHPIELGGTRVMAELPVETSPR